ncbi:MAG: hypothetical protein EOP10_25310 [Proteobacteria bacterium]|nr:MAG: hypothetical protein EOP10_25310 [Pseudomonadota bacterium]
MKKNRVLQFISGLQGRSANESFREDLKKSFEIEVTQSRSSYDIEIDAKDLWAKIEFNLPPQAYMPRAQRSSLLTGFALSSAAIIIASLGFYFAAGKSHKLSNNIVKSIVRPAAELDDLTFIHGLQMTAYRRSNLEWERSALNANACNPLKQSCVALSLL